MGLLAMPRLQCAGSGPRLTLEHLPGIMRMMHACDGWFPDTFSLRTITSEHLHDPNFLLRCMCTLYQFAIWRVT